jgi:hypothetical protein
VAEATGRGAVDVVGRGVTVNPAADIGAAGPGTEPVAATVAMALPGAGRWTTSVTTRVRKILIGATACRWVTTRTRTGAALAEGAAPNPSIGKWKTAAPASVAPAATKAIDAANARIVGLVSGTVTSGSES